MELNTSLFKQICAAPGPSGFEHAIRQLVIDQVTPLVHEVRVDNIGNVIAIRRGSQSNSKKVMIAAHMDEIGFIVNYINEQGFVNFLPLGGFDPKTLTAQRVIVHGRKDLIGIMGAKPIHVLTEEERKANPKLTDYFIDLGLPKEEVERFVQIGDPITRERDLIEVGNCLSAKSMDNRASVFILIEALRTLGNVPYDVYATFTVQEELGIRGANVAAQHIDPDFGIALDVSLANDTPNVPGKERCVELGKGAGIKLMDRMTVCDYRMVAYLKGIAQKNNIAWQAELKDVGGTDTSALQRRGKQGAIAGAISIPLRYMHQVIETLHKEDVQSAISLLKAALENIDQFDWQHRAMKAL